jgi:hypothetical protein
MDKPGDTSVFLQTPAGVTVYPHETVISDGRRQYLMDCWNGGAIYVLPVGRTSGLQMRTIEEFSLTVKRRSHS